MSVNSRAKGVRGELDAVHELIRLGVPARRTAQYQGQGSEGDIVVPHARVHIEVKRRRSIQFHRFLEQAMADARHGYYPLLLSKEDRGQWYAMCRLADIYHVAQQLVEAGHIHDRERQAFLSTPPRERGQ